MAEQKKIEDMTTAELLVLYNQLSGENVKRFSTREAGLKRVRKLMTKRLVTKETSPATKAKGKSIVTGAKALATGKTVLQTASVRRKVFDALAAHGGRMSVAELEKQLNFDPRPHLTKLKMFGHVELFTD